MGCQGIEVQIEAITGEKREAARSQELSQGVDNPMCHVLCARTEIEHGKKLGAGIDGQPQPQHLCVVAESCAQFVQLKGREPEVAE